MKYYLIILFVLFFIGCSGSAEVKDTIEKTSERFIYYKIKTPAEVPTAYLMVDTKTGTEYILAPKCDVEEVQPVATHPIPVN